MAERTAGGRAVHLRLEYRFDRLSPAKLQQAYQLLVPEKRWPVGVPPTGQEQEKRHEQNRGHLRTGFFGSSEGESYHRQPERRAARIRPGA